MDRKAAAKAKREGKPKPKPSATSNLRRYARAASTERISKEKERLKTDPVGQAKKYVKGTAKVANKAASLLKTKGETVGTSGGGRDNSSMSVEKR